MYNAILIVHIIVSLILVVIVLMQTGKGAELGAMLGGGSSQTLFGPTGPQGFLGKLTAGAAIIFMLTSLTLAYMSSSAPRHTIMDKAPAAKHEQAPPKQAIPPVTLPPAKTPTPKPVK